MIAASAAAAYRRLASASDRQDGAEPDVGPLATGWALAKLAVAGAVLPAGVAAVTAVAVHHTRAIQRDLPRYVEELVRVLADDPPTGVRVARRPAAGRYVITSDLHRAHAGRADWPARQGTKVLYAAMLDHYEADGWTLVENGDVEDLWLGGGSSYGVVFEAARLAAAVLPFDARHEFLTEVYRGHLDRIVANNADIYERLAGFADRDAYVRLVGNHDDAWSRSFGRAALADVVGGPAPVDHLVLDGAQGPQALVTHGHQSDGWNRPGGDRLGKLFTSLASALHDLPLGLSPGLPTPAATADLLAGRAPNELLELLPVIGADADTQTMDETKLYEATRASPVARVQVVLGHTHVPLVDPVHPNAGGPRERWTGYVNSGCGVFRDLVTAVEWDGAEPEPTARVVAWQQVGNGEARPSSRPARALERVELRPDPGDPGLLVVQGAPTVAG